MLDRSLPPTRRSASLKSAAIDNRLSLASGAGLAAAPLIWMMILASRTRRVSNDDLALDAGMAWVSGRLRRTERALAVLRDAGLLRMPRRRGGRVLEPQLAEPVRILIPDRGAMTNLWLTCGEARPRPVALVTAMTAAYALACHNSGVDRLERWAPVGATQAQLRRFVGASKGSTWNRRIGDLEGLGMLRRGPLVIAPPEEWFQGWRSLARFR